MNDKDSILLQETYRLINENNSLNRAGYTIASTIYSISKSYPELAQRVLDALNEYLDTGDFENSIIKLRNEYYNPKDLSSTPSEDANIIKNLIKPILFYRNKLDMVKENNWPQDVESLDSMIRGYVDKEKQLKQTEIDSRPIPDVTEEDWRNFEQHLRSHDWTYQRSDDHRVYINGRDEAIEIANLYDKLKRVDKKRAERLYQQYSRSG
jgi:hypothetical protein